MINQAQNNQNNQNLWHNRFPNEKNPYFKGKKKYHTSDIIASLELLGSSTTSEISRFILTYKKSKGGITKSDIRSRANVLNKLIAGRLKKTHSRKKLNEVYPGLEKIGILKKIDSVKSVKNIDTNFWFPSFKGHIISLGYDFDDLELIKFIDNASTNSLFFAYLKNLIDVTSIDTVKSFFLNPISELIKNGVLDLNNDIRYGIELISFRVGLEIERRIRYIKENLRKNNHDIIDPIEIIVNNTWYDSSTLEWENNMLSLYYKNHLKIFYYMKYSDPWDFHFLYNVMKQIHSSYYATLDEDVPSKYKQDFPISIEPEKKFEKDEYNIPAGLFMTALEREKYKK